MESCLKLICIYLGFLFSTQFAFADLINTPTDPGDPRIDRPVRPKPIPGILNPDYHPSCHYETGDDGKPRFVCSDFALDYCRQYPRSEDCFQVALEEAFRERCIFFSPIGRCLGDYFKHALNLVRVPLGEDHYYYCFVEPQRANDPEHPNTNPLVVCFIRPKTWDPTRETLPADVIDILCLYYATWGLSCDYLPGIKIYPGGTPFPGQPVSPVLK